jgi:hypothetical protein
MFGWFERAGNAKGRENKGQGKLKAGKAKGRKSIFSCL